MFPTPISLFRIAPSHTSKEGGKQCIALSRCTEGQKGYFPFLWLFKLFGNILLSTDSNAKIKSTYAI